MNQKICPNCQHINDSSESFCTNCGQMLPPVNQTSSQRETPTVEYSNPAATAAPTPNFTEQNQYQNQPPKKSRTGIWLALFGGGAVLLILFVGVIALGFFYYIGSQKTDPNYNSNSYSSNINTDPKLLPDEEKYRLFYAASKVNDAQLTMKVSKRIGIVDENGMPTDDYDGFMTGIIGWAFTDTDFVQKLDTKQKALDYINSRMPANSPAPKTESNSSSAPLPSRLSVGIVNDKASNLVEPVYPPAAKAVRASGTVNVQVAIDEEGNVTSAKAVSGHPLLRQASEQAARSSKFNPTILSGKAVKVTGIVVYNFKAPE